MTAYDGLPVLLKAMNTVIAHSLYRELRDVLDYKSWKTEPYRLKRSSKKAGNGGGSHEAKRIFGVSG